jgi:hypothetical protein
LINRQALLTDLQKLLTRLEADMLERSESAEVPDVGQTLRAEYVRAKDAERTAQNYEDWRSDAITQAAAAWVLSCVFVRFLEDNQLIEPPKIAGPTSVVSRQLSLVGGSVQNRLQLARDEHELYFREHPRETDRDYLLAVFDELAGLPGAKDMFGEHNPIRELPNWLSGDAAGELLRFFQKIVADTGDLVHDFTDADWDTRFLGDLYQDLSEAARKKYALLQTPEFVEEFILDRTLDPAIEEFGLDGFKMIDPACGSGHFLLGAFRRIEARWEKHAPKAKCREVVQSALDSIFGVDVNPFAVAIARFRLLLAALRTCGVLKLAKSPAFHVNLACGDSLYHGRQRQQLLGDDWTDEAHYFAAEDAPALRQMLREGTYHCVVANPPYITPKDRAANEAYRKLYPKTCHMQYSLSVPFMERIYRLAVDGGFTGQITANSFMKREFGRKAIEAFLPQVDLTHVVDTSGAHIPGHGTPTVILFGRHRKPTADTIRTVMGIRGEPSTPDDPARGLVWSAIMAQIDQPGSQGEFVSVADSLRELFQKHPWSIGGGGAAELKERLENQAVPLRNMVADIGRTVGPGDDDAWWLGSTATARRLSLTPSFQVLVTGQDVRDFTIGTAAAERIVYPYDGDSRSPLGSLSSPLLRFLWPNRTLLRQRVIFGRPMEAAGKSWWEYLEHYVDRLRTPLSIIYGEVATHNHFVLDRGGKLFNRTAPVIKLPPDATDDDHLVLLGPLNSSIACFWLKQVCQTKGSSGIGRGVYDEGWEKHFAYNATNLQQFPLPSARTTDLARQLDSLSRAWTNHSPPTVLTLWSRAVLEERQAEAATGESLPKRSVMTDDTDLTLSLRDRLELARKAWEALRGRIIALQEEVDWECYWLYGLVSDQSAVVNGQWQETTDDGQPATDPPPLALGQRAFEIVMARRTAAGGLKSAWFERHGSSPITDLPADWHDDYKRLVERRIELIETDRNIGLIEQPDYKRRWNSEPWVSQLERALRESLLGRLESYFDFDGRMNDDGKSTAKLDIALTTVSRLTDVARQDVEFMRVAEVYRGDPAFNVEGLVADLVEAESIPVLPVLRYKPSGIRKRQEWEKTWELQRREDAVDGRTKLPQDDPQYLTEDQARDAKLREVGDIPVPPKYASADFVSTGGARYWALRGKLDVPKERWISFPHCEGPDGTLVIAWAGYDHLQLARSISAYYVDIQERLGGRDDPRLVPLLACVVELLPWLRQWHHDIDPDYNQRMDEVFEGFIAEEAKALGMTVDQVKAWQPPQRAGGRGKRRAET